MTAQPNHQMHRQSSHSMPHNSNNNNLGFATHQQSLPNMVKVTDLPLISYS